MNSSLLAMLERRVSGSKQGPKAKGSDGGAAEPWLVFADGGLPGWDALGRDEGHFGQRG